MIRLFIAFCISISLAVPATFGQYNYQPVFSNLNGNTLLAALQENFTADTVLSYSEARDTLFGKIYSVNDSLECVYSGWKRYLTPGLDPTQAVFTSNGGNEDINTEHTYPRSKGAEVGNGYSDMHHLLPTRAPVNTDRSNDPFMEIPDSQTNKWYYKNQTLNSIPTTMIDSYAEDINNGFEPREESKGNVARAVFYFFTIYMDNCLTADPNFFEIQRETLCTWHMADPVDSLEWARTFAISEYQDGKINPFVVDCTLAARLYCPNIDASLCDSTVIIGTSELIPAAEWSFYPNPGKQTVTIDTEDTWTHIYIYNTQGVKMNTITLDPSCKKQSISINDDLPAGLYLFGLTNETTHTLTSLKRWVKE
jgi:endonuclease I